MYSSKNKLEATEKLFKDVSVDPKARLTQGRPMYSSPEGGRSVSFPPVPTGQRFSSPTKVGYSSSLQGRDLGLAPNPSLAEEIGDRHWRIPERRLRQRNDRKIVRYLRKQLRKRMQQYYEDEEYEDGFETIDEKPEKVPTETNPGPFVKYQEGNGKKDIFSQYNDVGGRLSKEGSFVDNGPFPPRVVKSPNLKKLYELQSEQTETDETEVDRVKAPSPVVNGFHAKGVTFAEQEFEIVGRSETPRPKSASELSVLSISSNSSNRQVPDSLPDICTTPVPSQNGQESPPQSSLDNGKKIKLPAISKATPKETTAGTPDEGYMDAVESELRKVEERPDTRSSVESEGIQRPAFTPVQTPYPLPVGRSDTCDYLKLNYKDTVDAIVKGRLDVKCHINKRIIRMYISSNISDSEAERNGLMEKVYPQLRLYCKERGYAFQMIDPNWALKDAIVDNHSHQELCLKELNTARDISMGPNFVTFLSQKYGQCVIPTTIPVEEFKKFISLMQSGKESYLASHVNRNVAGLEKEKTSDSLKSNTDDKTTENQTQNSEEESEDKKESEDKGEASAEGTQENQVTSQETDEALERRKTDREYDAEMSILNMWYKLDDNMVPPVYRLQPISSQYRDINHRDKFRRTTAKQHWTSQCKRLEAIFLNYIKDVTDDQQRIDEYIKSTIEREIEEGILNLKDKPYDTVQWFRRNITDLKYNLTDFSAKDYIDLVTDENDQTEIDMVKTKRLHDLMDQKMPSKVSLAQMHEYSVSWHQDGIKPDKNRGHLLYVDKMCNDLFSIIRGKIDHSIQKKTASRDAKKRLYDEITPHVTFVRERSRDFNGRKEVLNRIKEYVRVGPRKPLIIHGKSGYGKTSVMAKAAKDAPSWIKSGDPAVVVRMIGVTGDSVHIRQLLRSMSLQLCYIFGQDTSLVPQDYRGALNDFNSRLASATPERPLFVFLDSLDQLSDENNGHALQWLPLELPENVYMVVSTLTEDTYDTFKTVKRLFGNSDNFVEIPELPESDAVFILEHLLEQESRTLTDEQHDAVLKAFRNCPSPLYLRLVFEETRLWRSYSTEKEIWVPTAISKIINMLFSRMETQHGEPFVRRALGYITAARSGVTESELLDLLSLDDLVLGDVSNHFPLPVRRFPPVLWMRLRHDLQWYLVEHSADYEWTYQWSHVQLHQAAVERYLNQKDKAPSYHTALSELFMGVWADKKKPYPGRDAGSLRYVDSQALSHTIVSPTGKVKTLFNLRTVNELPYHLINSNQFEKLKKKVLLNFDWLLAKVRATSLRAVLDDFHNAMLIEPGDKELKLLADCLQLSETALLRNPLELATQVVGRLNDIIRKDKPISIGDPKKYPNMGRFMRQAKNAAIAGFIPSVTCLTPPGDVMYDLLAGHTDVITAVTASMDGTIAMTASKDKTMKLWDFRTGRVTKTIEGTGDQIHAIRLCLNNMYAVTAETGCIRFWNMRNSQCQLAVDDLIDPASITAAGNNSQIVVAFYFGVNIMRSWDLENDFQRLQDVKIQEDQGGIHKDRSLCISFNSSGDNVLYAFRSGNMAYSRNARSGKLVHSLKASQESASITAVAISREYYIVSCRYQYMKLAEIYHLELFDTQKGSFLRSVKGCTTDKVVDLMVNKVGSHALCLCSSADTNTTEIAVWNIETEEHKHLARHAKVSSMGICMDLNYCLTASKDDRALRIWNLSRKINDRDSVDKPKQREGIAELLPMKDNPRYVIARNSGGGPISVWNVVKTKCALAPIRVERSLVGEHDIVLVRNEKVVILTDRGMSSVSEEPKPVFQTIYIYDLKTKKYERKLAGVFIVPSPAHEYRLLDGDLLMGLSDNRDHLICWNLVTGHVVQRIKTKFKEIERLQRTMRTEPGHANGTLKEDRSKGVRREMTPMMTPWERRSETQTARQRRKENEADDEKKRLEDLKKEKENAIEQYILSKDEKIIVASYFAHHMCVFDVNTQTHTATLEMESSMLYLHNAAMTPTGSSLVHANYDDWDKVSYVTLWDLKTGQVRKRIKNEPNICCMAISADASRVVFGNDKNMVKVWDPMQKTSLRKIKGYEGLKLGVGSQMFLVEKGTQAIVFSGDISLWDLENNTILAVYTPDTRIQCMDVMLDGLLIVFGLRDSTSVITLKYRGKDVHVKQPEIAAPELFAETTGDTDDEDTDDEEEDAEKSQNN